MLEPFPLGNTPNWINVSVLTNRILKNSELYIDTKFLHREARMGITLI